LSSLVRRDASIRIAEPRALRGEHKLRAALKPFPVPQGRGTPIAAFPVTGAIDVLADADGVIVRSIRICVWRCWRR
jgi:hypothetical protein